MSFHVYQCARCGKYVEGAAYYRRDIPRDRYGRVTREARDDKAEPRYCSEECRDS